MQTSVTDLPDSRVKIAASVPADELERKLERAAKGLAGEMKLPGFRRGKVPPQLALQRIGREAVLEQALRDGLPEWYEQALLDSGVTPVGDPRLDMPEAPAEGDPLEFTIEIAVRPEAKLGPYDGLEVGKAEPEVPAEAIDAELERIREGLASLAPVERQAGPADYLLIDFRGELDGEPFEGGEAKDYLLELGSDALIEGFNEGLAGAAAGEQRTVEVTFPDDYHAEQLAGEDATFTIDVKEVREKRVPELDDDFAAESSEFDTLAELRADVESKLREAFEQRAAEQFREAVLDAAVEAAVVEVPEDVVNARATEIWERVERSLSAQGMEPETYLRMQGQTREEAIESAREDAEQGLRREAVLAAVADAEGIEVDEGELLAALAPPAGEKGKPEKLLKRLRSEGRDKLLAEDIRMRKAADLLVERAQPIELGRAEAREKIWTPEQERAAEGEGELWTPDR